MFTDQFNASRCKLLAIALALGVGATPAMAADEDAEVERFGAWLTYAVPGSDAVTPVLYALEIAEPVAGLTVTLTCTLQGGRSVQELLLHNPGFAEIPDQARFEATLVLASGNRLRYVDATLRADPRHESLIAEVEGHGRVTGLAEAMAANEYLSVTQDGAEITPEPVPLDGFAEGLEAHRDDCLRRG